ncbi:FitA-like ribbon-helix-helix domain-containing protein [Methylobacterium variabile]|uniref:FitA-like ribbon-helix-helix domain-containing protein n=1 Tax=Methylobacterium variabile TaxID=298794 RepID=UPI000B1CF462
MAALTIRNLETPVGEPSRPRAARNGRSVEADAILAGTVAPSLRAAVDRRSTAASG